MVKFGNMMWQNSPFANIAKPIVLLKNAFIIYFINSSVLFSLSIANCIFCMLLKVLLHVFSYIGLSLLLILSVSPTLSAETQILLFTCRFVFSRSLICRKVLFIIRSVLSRIRFLAINTKGVASIFPVFVKREILERIFYLAIWASLVFWQGRRIFLISFSRLLGYAIRTFLALRCPAIFPTRPFVKVLKRFFERALCADLREGEQRELRGMVQFTHDKGLLLVIKPSDVSASRGQKHVKLTSSVYHKPACRATSRYFQPSILYGLMAPGKLSLEVLGVRL
jgi:hypothetical protein